MWCKELPPAALRDAALVSVSGQGRLASTPAWLDAVAAEVPSYCGPGATLHVLAAFDRGGALAALPLVRTRRIDAPRPFPMDIEDLFFGLWARHVPPEDPTLRLRAAASRALGAMWRRGSPWLSRGLIVHAPLSSVSDALVSPSLGPSATEELIGTLLSRAVDIAAAEDRCFMIPRLLRRDAVRWGRGLAEIPRAATYPIAERTLGESLSSRTSQMIRRNARLVARADIDVQVTEHAPPDVPFASLFEETARRHADPAPHLEYNLFNSLAERFPGRVKFLCARDGDGVLGFVTALADGPSWEAWKCGVDRAAAGGAPVYLDLVFGRLPDLAARGGATTLGLGTGSLGVKRRYGARVEPVDVHVSPPSLLGRGALLAYVRAVGEGIARAEPATAQAPTRLLTRGKACPPSAGFDSEPSHISTWMGRFW